MKSWSAPAILAVLPMHVCTRTHNLFWNLPYSPGSVLHCFHTLQLLCSDSPTVLTTLSVQTRSLNASVLRPMYIISCQREIVIIILGRNSALSPASPFFGTCFSCCLPIFLFCLTGYQILRALILPYISCPGRGYLSLCLYSTLDYKTSV